MADFEGNNRETMEDDFCLLEDADLEGDVDERFYEVCNVFSLFLFVTLNSKRENMSMSSCPYRFLCYCLLQALFCKLEGLEYSLN